MILMIRRLLLGSAEGQMQSKPLMQRIHLDSTLVILLLLLVACGCALLYSASGQSVTLLKHQGVRLTAAFAAMIFLAQIPPRYYQRWASWLYCFGVVLLVAVLLFGHISNGAQRWLDLGFFQFQPAELMKIALPIALAVFLSGREPPLPLGFILIALTILLIPFLLIIKQPDLGTALLIGASGFFVIFLAGISWRWLLLMLGGIGICAPVIWQFLHAYQKKRILTLLNPESDPLGSGYHIIQSKIAIGSGGFAGKGLLQGTQSNLEFLPERTTDFIFSVLGEEVGFVGVAILLILYFLIIVRGCFIALNAEDQFSRLLAGSLVLTFFTYVFVNIGMVSGLLPVVGVPLPLISYGGSSMVTLMAGFGILMSIQTHKKSVV
ncbi:Rod shape-determining protein RodA [Piscirickettsia salmonis]|uniref:Peptidoglycan glycosyltransferase MrdB n=1 Tax=Piscirickettsia salmonis TaxID=1238 RepID=A0AAC8VK54_PISSA|nr:rod shape-determining protein RodA [Piscirickettsia salmonis]ALB23952.1 rod shape-determining protein RodA [Piscirickettsia salmonis]QGN97453.1 Rod shape-determining protein RodA [Piscirickettsia salmonis]QGO01054.1 Rod shape-determining protein RodA [Piscirickettsia salmonis]QGO11772.1 Rod shape-determining protein RodA [Piscirickettsia salmonis]QGO18798.1 Rod shape-determining protein RodA [Piscirickettsia salmonis]